MFVLLSSVHKAFFLVAEPQNKMTMQVSKEFVKYFERNTLADGITSLKFLEEEMRVDFVTFPMKPYSPFSEEFKSKIEKLIEAGICPEKLAIGTFAESSKLEKTDIEVPALVLTIDDLAVGFLVCLVPLALSFVVFIGELLVPFLIRLAVKIRCLLTFRNLIQAFLKMRVS